MDYQTQRLYRAIVRYMNGDVEECKQIIKGMGTGCPNCGGRMVKAKYYKEKDVAIPTLLCTDCNKRYHKGEEIPR